MRIATPLAVAIALSALAGIAGSVRAAEEMDGTALLAEVKAAYAETDRLLAHVHLSIESKRGRWAMAQEAVLPFAYQREPLKVSLDRPDQHVVVEDGRLKLRSENIFGRYLDMVLEGGVTYEGIVAANPYLGDPHLPPLAFLLAADPIAAMSGPAMPNAEPAKVTEAVSEDGAPQLKFAGGGKRYTLTLDPETKLVAHMLAEVEPMYFGGGPGEYMRTILRIEPKPIEGNALPAATFAMNVDGLQKAANMQELIAPPDAAQMQAMQQGGGANLVDKPSPAVVTKTLTGKEFDLAKTEAKVVVLDFWATWCGPCEPALQGLQKVHDALQREGKPVEIYAVNANEAEDAIKAYVEQHALTMPVLLDPGSAIFQAFGLGGYPTTVVIADGVVKHVHEGFAPGLADQLRGEIDALLAAGAAPGDAAAERGAPAAPR